MYFFNKVIKSYTSNAIINTIKVLLLNCNIVAKYFHNVSIKHIINMLLNFYILKEKKKKRLYIASI